MNMEDEFTISVLEAPPVKLQLTGPVWMYPICRPKILAYTGCPVEGETVNRVVVIWVGSKELGVPSPKAKPI